MRRYLTDPIHEPSGLDAALRLPAQAVRQRLERARLDEDQQRPHRIRETHSRVLSGNMKLHMWWYVECFIVISFLSSRNSQKKRIHHPLPNEQKANDKPIYSFGQTTTSASSTSTGLSGWSSGDWRLRTSPATANCSTQVSIPWGGTRILWPRLRNSYV